MERREFLATMAGAILSAQDATGLAFSPESLTSTVQKLKAGWNTPARTYRPRTFWLWPGNAVTKDGISWTLQQMHDQGIGGVKIMSVWNMYVKGNIPYLSEEWLEMVRHTLRTARDLDMEVSLFFDPGWSLGGFWVPPTDRSKALTPAWVDVTGPGLIDQELPSYSVPKGSGISSALNPNFRSDAPDENQLVAVVAGKLVEDRLDEQSLIDITGRVENNHLRWDIPEGRWRIASYRLKYTGQTNQAQNYNPENWVVNHFNKAAMQRYCDYLGGVFFRAFGSEFGKTLETLHSDSFEVKYLKNTILWSNDTLELFRIYMGYDLTRFLPAIWWNIGELTPKIRYDVNDFLHRLGLETFFNTFIEWCKEHNIAASIQPHDDFPTELIQAAGLVPRSETEITIAGFEVVTFPRKSAAAGVRFYGKDFLQSEVFTWIHPERFRTTLEEMKIAADGFLRDGVSQFYTTVSWYSPEMQVAPSRSIHVDVTLNHWNTWWKYYHYFTKYVSRCCFLLRQGKFTGDILVYSPQATVWTQKVLGNTGWREVPYGTLGKTLVANGYDFDPVNDDLLQNHARAEGGRIKIRDYAYSLLILPHIQAMPVETLEFLRTFVQAGGILIALGSLPASSVGRKDFKRRDKEVQAMVVELFGADSNGRDHPGGGRTYYMRDYVLDQYDIHPRNQPRFEPTPPLSAGRASLIKTLRRHLRPDFMLEGDKQSDGLTFLHRTCGDVDIYFVTNLQPQRAKLSVTFRVAGKQPEQWDPMTGRISPVHHYRPVQGATELPLDLAPLESTFLLFLPVVADRPYVTKTNLIEVRELTENSLTGIVAQNGSVVAEVATSLKKRLLTAMVSDLPPVLEISGKWHMILEGAGFERYEQEISQLASWTESVRTMHFSGTGRYERTIQIPEEYFREDLELILDLGNVGTIAEVALNGKSVGVSWMRPYALDITGAVRKGDNQLKILVTNTLINRVSGMTQPQEIPAELVPHYGPTPELLPLTEIRYRGSFSYCGDWRVCGAIAAKQESGYTPLPPSGLIDPVRIIPQRRVSFKV